MTWCFAGVAFVDTAAAYSSTSQPTLMDQLLYGPIIPVIVLFFIVFFITRWFWCWYFKINQVVKVLESIDLSLRQLPAVANKKDRV